MCTFDGVQEELTNREVYTIEQKVARICSYILHPLLMPTYGLILIYYSKLIPGFNPYSIQGAGTFGWDFISWSFVFTAFLPGILALLMKKKGYISSIQMPQKNERILPFTVTGVCYLILFYLPQFMYDYDIPFVLKLFLMGSLFAIIFGVIITFFWKISVHMIGIGGVCGIFFLFGVLQEPQTIMLSFLFAIAGIVGFSRLALNAHTMNQVVAGFLLGFFCESLLVWVIP